MVKHKKGTEFTRNV